MSELDQKEDVPKNAGREYNELVSITREGEMYLLVKLINVPKVLRTYTWIRGHMTAI